MQGTRSRYPPKGQGKEQKCTRLCARVDPQGSKGVANFHLRPPFSHTHHTPPGVPHPRCNTPPVDRAQQQLHCNMQPGRVRLAEYTHTYTVEIQGARAATAPNSLKRNFFLFFACPPGKQYHSAGEEEQATQTSLSHNPILGCRLPLAPKQIKKKHRQLSCLVISGRAVPTNMD